jgi:hypothetical protein
MQGATRNIEPRGCVFVGGIDPGVLEINDPQQRRSLSNNAGFGLLSLAQGFGGGGSTPEMAIETFDKMEAFVISRNAGIDKVMRGIGIANRFSAGMNGTRADTSTEDPSLFCTEERVIKGLAEQCRFHSDEASLMMAASPPVGKQVRIRPLPEATDGAPAETGNRLVIFDEFRHCRPWSLWPLLTWRVRVWGVNSLQR